jgi:glycosyltransferase involved in cell wall biosynthesis
MQHPVDESMLPGDVPSVLLTATTDPRVVVRFNTPEDNRGVIGSYQWIYERTTEDILAFLHDDVIIHEDGWDQRVLDEFRDQQVGMVGFGGARQHGWKDLYKLPYDYHQLGRGGYISNVDDAESHGQRIVESQTVSVLDGFCLCIRRHLLDGIGGLSLFLGNCDFFCYDYALCASCRRLGYHTRVVPIGCHHRGGQTSSRSPSAMTSPEAYAQAHRWFYETYRDVMPAEVQGPVMKEPPPELVGRDGSIQNFMFDIERAARLSNGFVLELGCSTGTGSTLAIQRGLKDGTNPLHISVDLEDHLVWRPEVDWWHLVIGDSRDREILAQVMKYHRSPGLIFIDTEHTYNQMKAELELWSAIANENTVWLFHDTNMWGKGDQYGMVQAIQEFANQYGWLYEDFRPQEHGLGRMQR